MPSVGFEQAIPANERPKTHALERAATGADHIKKKRIYNFQIRPTIAKN